MTYSDTQPCETLRYRLLSASLLPSSSAVSDPGSCGHEYVRHLAAELGEEYTFRTVGETPETSDNSKGDAPAKVEKPPPAPAMTGTIEDLRALAVQLATFLLSHNAEPGAVDLLEELHHTLIARLSDTKKKIIIAERRTCRIYQKKVKPTTLHQPLCPKTQLKRRPYWS